MLFPNMADVESEHNIQGSGIIQIPASCINGWRPSTAGERMNSENSQNKT